MNGWIHSCIFDGQVVAQIIVEDAKKKGADYVKMNYEALVQEIAQWLKSWLLPSLPEPSGLIALLTDTFLIVMKAKRKSLTIENYMEFAEELRADVLRELTKDVVKRGKGYRTAIKNR